MIEPGEDADRIRHSLRDSGLRCVSIDGTHGRFDHVGAARSSRAARDSVYSSREGIFLLERITGVPAPDPAVRSYAADVDLDARKGLEVAARVDLPSTAVRGGVHAR